MRWKLVPVEPTEAMREEADGQECVYAAMLAAAPSAADDPDAVERVARALATVDGQDPDGLDASFICDACNRPLPIWKGFEEEARAAIRAMEQ